MSKEDSEVRIRALQIAAGVFAQVIVGYNVPSKKEGTIIQRQPKPRTLTVFRESVDVVFKALEIKKIDWTDDK